MTVKRTVLQQKIKRVHAEQKRWDYLSAAYEYTNASPVPFDKLVEIAEKIREYVVNGTVPGKTTTTGTITVIASRVDAKPF